MRIIVDTDLEHLPEIMDLYDQISIQRSDSEEGVYVELVLIDLQAGKDSYVYYDDEGSSTNWYKTAFYNSSTEEYSKLSEAFMAESLPGKFGYCFRNYSPLKGIWGEALTADDLRYNYCWGIDMLASDLAGSDVDDEQLKFAVEAALAEFEKHFDIDIRKRIYKTTPSEDMVRAPEWQEGVDYTDKEMEYDFDPAQWRNYGFIQLRHKPVISIERAELYSAWDQKILDVLDWIRLYEKSGQLNIYPKGSTMFGTGYMGSGIIAAMPGLYSSKYPQGFKIDYTTGCETSDYIPNDLRNAIGMLATLNVLGSVGDGLASGFSSSSVSLDGLSESFSSTQSATSAWFGARIKSYTDQLKIYINKNKGKYGNLAMGMIKG